MAGGRTFAQYAATTALVACFLACSGAVADHDHGDMGAELSAAMSQCITNSTLPECADFHYPSVTAHADLDDLCVQMAFMPACSVYAHCNATASSGRSGSSSTGTNCEAFNLLATICVLDGMGGMRGCQKYNSLCQAGTQVQQCTTSTGLTAIPTTQQANDNVKSICTEMTMDGCEKCTPDWDRGQTYSQCDLLAVYGQLCVAMPTMRQCDLWKSSCASNKDLYFCSGSSATGGKRAPTMIMYFNEKLPFYLLFKEWTPSTTATYVGSWFAIFFLGVFYEAIVTLKSIMEARWACKAYSITGDKEQTGARTWFRPCLSVVDVCRGLFQFVVVGLAYLLMLAAMSFNLGIFFAVVSGIAVGTMFFGRYRRMQSEEPCCMA